MDFIGTYIKSLKPDVSQDTIDSISSLTSYASYKKGDVLVKEGDKSDKCFLLISGIVRSYIEGKNGKEHTKMLYIAPALTGALSSLIMNQGSESTFECVADCEIAEVSYYKIIEGCESNHEKAILHYKMLEQAFVKREQKIHDLCVLDGTEHYLKLKKELPNIENLIPQYLIASYLNITPVQLSRIRKELYSK